MSRESYINEVSAFVNKPIDLQRDMDLAFVQLTHGLSQKRNTISYPSSIFYFKKGIDMALFQYKDNFRTRCVVCSRETVWDVFRLRYEFTDFELEWYMAKQFEKHFKISCFKGNDLTIKVIPATYLASLKDMFVYIKGLDD